MPAQPGPRHRGTPLLDPLRRPNLSAIAPPSTLITTHEGGVRLHRQLRQIRARRRNLGTDPPNACRMRRHLSGHPVRSESPADTGWSRAAPRPTTLTARYGSTSSSWPSATEITAHTGTQTMPAADHPGGTRMTALGGGWPPPSRHRRRVRNRLSAAVAHPGRPPVGAVHRLPCRQATATCHWTRPSRRGWPPLSSRKSSPSRSVSGGPCIRRGRSGLQSLCAAFVGAAQRWLLLLNRVLLEIIERSGWVPTRW
jgi:hypothetical protein